MHYPKKINHHTERRLLVVSESEFTKRLINSLGSVLPPRDVDLDFSTLDWDSVKQQRSAASLLRGDPETGLMSRHENALPTKHNADIHLCICFFGILLGLNSTIQSIEDNLFGVLKASNIRFTTYLHAFHPSTLMYNSSSGDNTTTVNSDYTRLNPKMAIVETQDAFDSVMDVEQYATKGDSFGHEMKSLRNQIREGISLEQVTRLWLHDTSKCTHVLYTRPDLLVVAPFDVTELYRVGHMSWFTGQYHEHGGLNSRFAFGDPEGMRIWGYRNRLAEPISRNQVFRAESFAKYVSQKTSIRHQHTKLCLLKYRVTGSHFADVGMCNGSYIPALQQ